MYINLTDYVKQQIIDYNDIVDVIEESIPLKKAGVNYSACCPFHKEKTPSFIVSKQKQIYRCFGCGKSGNVINFLMEYKNWTYIETIEYLAQRANITLEKSEYTSEQKLKNNYVKKLYEINREAARFFYKVLQVSEEPMKYLENRNIDKDIIKRFGLGYTVKDWSKLLNYLKSKGYKEEDIEKTGLIILGKKNNYYDRFRERVMFPIIDLKKNVIGFGGRVLDDSLPKYMNSPESMAFIKGNNLYGLNIARDNVKDNSFFLVEGYMDVIKMHVHGYNTAVAALGTALTDNQIKLMKRYSEKFYICFDSDEAGQKAALRAINMFKSNNLNAKVIFIKGAKDPDEFLNKYGKIKFDLLINNAMDYYEFLEFYYKKELESSDKVGFINSIYNNIINLKSDIEREIIIEKLSLKVDISKESLISDFNKKYKKNVKYVKKPEVKVINQVKPVAIVNKANTPLHEEEMIKYIIMNFDLSKELKDIVYDIDFKDYKYINIFNTIFESYNDNSISIESIVALVTDEFDMSKIMVENTLEDRMITASFFDCYNRMKIKYLEELRTNKKNGLENISDSSLLKEESLEVIRLSQKIKSLKEEVINL